MTRSRRFILIAGILAVAAAGFRAAPLDDDFFAIRKNFQVFGKIYEHLVTGYVNDVDPGALMRTGIEAMLRDLDPYTVFYDEGDIADIRTIVRGNLGSVGLDISTRNGKLTVSSPDEGTSSYKQGVRTGDVITHIAGQTTDSLSVADAQSLLAGEPGTGIEVIIKREGLDTSLTFLLTRAAPSFQNVSYSGRVIDNEAYGYIKLDRFGNGADTEVRDALAAMLEEGELNGLILDLRDNGGGLLEAAVAISGLFVPYNTRIVAMRGRHPQSHRIYVNEQQPLAPDLPLTVLTSRLSASASEIVAGAMQDLDRGVVVGETTFGKGIVQVVTPMPFNTSLKMTTAKYFIPSGRSIQSFAVQQEGTRTQQELLASRTFKTAGGRPIREGHGIEPDKEVDLGAPSPLEEALNRRGAFFFFANAYAAEHPTITPDFNIDDSVFEAFKAWLITTEFEYETEAERTRTQLSEELQLLGYTGARDEVQKLEAAIQQEKTRDFDRHRERLSAHLRSEILARYYGQTAQIEASFGQDPQFQTALALLKDTRAYRRLLQP